jgi:hypothetical protein
MVCNEYDLTSLSQYPIFYNVKVLHRPAGSIGVQENGWGIRWGTVSGLVAYFSTPNSYTASTISLNSFAMGTTTTVSSAVGPVLGNKWVNLTIYDSGSRIILYVDTDTTTATSMVLSASTSSYTTNRKMGPFQGYWYVGNAPPAYDYVVVDDTFPSVTVTPTVTATSTPVSGISRSVRWYFWNLFTR